MTLYLIPISLFIILFLYVFFSLRKAWDRIGIQDESSSSQSERTYKAFEFYFTITIAILGGIGYLRVEEMTKDSVLARQGMIFLAILQNISMVFLVIAVTSHWGSKWERWKEPGTKQNIKTDWWRMVEPWMIILSFVIGITVWFIANLW